MCPPVSPAERSHLTCLVPVSPLDGNKAQTRPLFVRDSSAANRKHERLTEAGRKIIPIMVSI